MKDKKLLNAIGDIDEKYILEAEPSAFHKSDKKKKIRIFGKAVSIPVAAAISAAAFAITVGAAFALDLNQLFGDVFITKLPSQTTVINTPTPTETAAQSDTATEITSQAAIEEMSTKFDFNKHGKPLDLSYEFDEFKLNIKAIVADDYSAHILYDVIFDNDFDYGEKVGFSDWDMICVGDTLTGDIITQSNALIEKNGNVFSYYQRLDSRSECITLSNQTITLDFKTLYRAIPSDSEKDPEPWKEYEELKCEQHVEIPINFDTSENTRSFFFNDEVILSGLIDGESTKASAVLTEIIVTPLNWRISFNVDVSKRQKGEGYDLELAFISKNGESVGAFLKMEGYDKEKNEAVFSGAFDPLINTEGIDSVEINGKVFELE